MSTLVANQQISPALACTPWSCSYFDLVKTHCSAVECLYTLEQAGTIPEWLNESLMRCRVPMRNQTTIPANAFIAFCCLLDSRRSRKLSYTLDSNHAGFFNLLVLSSYPTNQGRRTFLQLLTPAFIRSWRSIDLHMCLRYAPVLVR